MSNPALINAVGFAISLPVNAVPALRTPYKRSHPSSNTTTTSGCRAIESIATPNCVLLNKHVSFAHLSRSLQVAKLNLVINQYDEISDALSTFVRKVPKFCWEKNFQEISLNISHLERQKFCPNLTVKRKLTIPSYVVRQYLSL